MRHPLRETLRYLLLIAASIVAVVPLLWLVTVALKTQAEFTLDPTGLPESFTLENFKAIFENEQIRRTLINTILVVVAAVPLVTVTSAAAGYALARLWGGGGNVVMAIFLLSEVIPLTILIVPLYLTIKELGIGHGVVKLIFVYSVMLMGFSVLVFRAFFRSIPEALREAAKLDGAGELQVFRRVMLPLARSPVTLIAIISFLVMWNEFFLASVLINSVDQRTLPLGLTEFRGQYETDWPKVAAALLLSSVPTLILYALFQNRIVRPFDSSAARL